MHNDEPIIVTCPVCGEECDALYYDLYKECVGCSECIVKKDYIEVFDEVKGYA